MRNSEFIEGVAIIGKYLKPDGYSINPAHDQIFIGDYSAVTDEKDVARLLELGWFEDEDAWSCFT